MKKFLLLIISALFSGLLFAQPAETYIGEKVKVTFPGKPDSATNPMGAKMLTYKNDPAKICAALSLDVAQWDFLLIWLLQWVMDCGIKLNLQ